MKSLTRLALPALLLFATIPLAFSQGWNGEYEHLQFEVRWLFIPGGTAIIHAERMNQDTVNFRIEACTNPTMDLIHKVRDQIMVFAKDNADNYASYYYRFIQNEGKHQTNRETSYGEPGAVTVIDHMDKQKHFYSVPENTLDLVTAFFSTRAEELVPGSSLYFPVFDKDKSYNLEVSIEEKTTANTLFGKKTPVVIIQPKLESDGIFKRTGGIRIWLTDDDRHIPVRLESKIKVGKIIADLTGISNQPISKNEHNLYCEIK